MTPEESKALDDFIERLEDGLRDGDYYWFEIGPDQSRTLLSLLRELRARPADTAT
jgi:hypothetical protein